MGRYGVWSAAGALLASELGCGGRVTEELSPAPPGPPPVSAPSPPRPARPTPAQSSPPAPSAPASSPPVLSPPPPSVPTDEGYDERELREAQVSNILLSHCGACHGPPLTPEQAFGNLWFIDDVEELTERGLIVPLRSADSRIVQVMRDGSMPPPWSGLGPVSRADLLVVTRFIDEPRFWPVSQPPPASDAGVAPLPADAGASSD